MRQVEAVPARRGHLRVHLLARAVHDPQLRPQRPGRQDPLARTVPVVREHRAQALVPVHDIGERGTQRLLVDAVLQRYDQRDVVRRRRPVQPVEEPHPLLRERQRHPRGTRRRLQRGQPDRRRGLLGQPERQGRGRGRVEEHRQRDVPARLGTQPAQEPHRQQRVPAQVEEVGGHAHGVLGQPQHLGEQAADQRLFGRRRALPRRGAGEVRLGQRPFVELAVRGQRQGVDRHTGGRDHVTGQPLGQVGAQLGRVRSVSRGGHGVRDELRVTVRGAPYDDRRRDDLRVIGEHGLDLAGFDTEPADLHLLVGASYVLQDPVGPTPGEVAGAVHPRAGRAERVLNEPLGRQLGPPEVAGRHTRTRHVHLAGHPGRNRPECRIEQMDAEIGQRGADHAGSARIVQVGAGQALEGDMDGRLRDAVHVDERRRVQAVPVRPRPQPLRPQRLTTEHDVPQRRFGGLALQVRPHQLLERGRGLIEHRDPLLPQQPKEVARRAADRVRHDDEPSAVQQRTPDLPDGEVEGVRVEERPHVVRAEVEVLGGRLEQPQHMGVRNGNALGAAGGTGGVDDVRDVVRAGGSGAVRVGEVAGRAQGEVLVGLRAAQDNGRRRHGGQRPRGCGVGDEHDRRYVLGDEPQPLRRVTGVQRQIRGPRLEHGEQRHDESRPARQRERDHLARSRTALDEQSRQLVGGRVEFGVAEVIPLAGHRGGVRNAGRLLLEAPGEGVRDGVGAPGPGLRLLARQQQRNVGECRLPVPGGELVQQTQEPPQVGVQFRLLVRRRVGVERQPQATGLGARAHTDLQVVDRAPGEVVGGRGMPGERQVLGERDHVYHRSVRLAPRAHEAQVAAHELAPVLLVPAQ